MSFNAENWDSYLESFRTYFMELNSTDPNRFSLGLLTKIMLDRYVKK